MAHEFKLPELGENIDSGDVVRVLVKVGDTIARDDAVIEIETDKAVIEVPAESAGTVTELRVKEGERAAVGQVLMLLDRAEEESIVPQSPGPESLPELPHERPETVQEHPVIETAPEKTEHSPASGESPVAKKSKLTAPAAPSVRREARELGVDISTVKGSGHRGRISVADVRAHVKGRNLSYGSDSETTNFILPSAMALPDFSRFGDIRREGMSNVRKATARHMATTWNTVPQVTQFDKADISNLEVLRKSLAAQVEAAGGKLTITAILLKIVAAALKKFPEFCVSVDMANEEIVYKDYANVGIAVDTPRGLLVPVIRNVDQKSITDLSKELSEISLKARNRKTSPDDLQGGCFTISNLGGIGGTGFSPIVNAPEVAILGVSRSTMEPHWNGGEFSPALMMPLSLSYDHRVIDGAGAARFLRWICQALEQPLLLAL